jgi:epoxyqueuosine reductase
MAPDVASPATPDADSLIADLRAEAMRLGFSRLGIAPAVTPPNHGRFTAWLDRGLAGSMAEWLARHEPLRRDPATLLAGSRSVIMLATDYSSPAAATVCMEEGRGRVSRYAWGDDYHGLLRDRVNTLAAWLRAHAPGCSARGVVDSAPLAERDFGWLAGLGWFGKNTMLIDTRAGSFFFLTALLTDLALPPDSAVEVDHCGTCTACLDACPTGALPAPRVLDATKCISALTIEDHGPLPPAIRPGLGEWIFGCDICQDVCPWNRHAPVTAEPAFQPRAGEATLALADLLALDDEGFRRRFAGSPLLRAKRRGLARSAAIALGNRPAPASFPALAAALDDVDPVIRGAAAWALGCWRRGGGNLAARSTAALEARRSREMDPAVAREIAAALADDGRETG